MPPFAMLAFDADDTLWHNERLYVDAQARLADLLSAYQDGKWVRQRLFQTESHNMQHYGYGIKAFTLSMIETAIELTEGKISGQYLGQILAVAKGMLNAEVELLDHVGETIPLLAETHPLMLITKGDLLEQERKIKRSGMARYFKHVEIVSQKSRENYSELLKQHGIPPERFLMVGNSPRSDILPILELGGNAVYIPYETTWLHEAADLPPEGQAGFYALQHMGELPTLIAGLEK